MYGYCVKCSFKGCTNLEIGIIWAKIQELQTIGDDCIYKVYAPH